MSCTVAIGLCPLVTLVRSRVTEKGCRAAAIVCVAVLDVPPAAAVMTALPLPVSVETVKVAEGAPPDTTMLEGTVARAVFELVRVTVVPPVGAAPLRVTVPVEVEDPNTVVGLRVRVYGIALAEVVSATVLFVPAFEAVIVDEPVVAAVRVAATNVANVAPAGTVTLDGTVALVVAELVSVTTVPPEGAGA
ncbi:MAG TPA: hypothetical protein PLB01_05005 [Thermoanaerobaculia bacterium]|nr:hypothetical protein [Thermoanaerobaculia bacterium]